MPERSLKDIDYGDLGEFGDGPGSFTVRRYHLEEPWGYIYTTPRMLLRVDQRGPVYAQFEPPGGTVLFRRERFSECPSFFVLFRTAAGTAFSNFWGPVTGLPPGEPESFECEYRPEKATYRVLHDALECETELFVPDDEAVVVCSCVLRNLGDSPRELDVIPVLRPHLAAGSLAPWDVSSLYQRVTYSNERCSTFEMELRNPAGVAENRRYAFVLCDMDASDTAEVGYARFVGRGSLEQPESVLTIDAAAPQSWGDFSPATSANGEQGVAALSKKIALEPGQSYSLTVVMGAAPGGLRGQRPSLDNVMRHARLFDREARQHEQAAARERHEATARARRMSTPDPALDGYVNEFLPLQLSWVRTLDRGWPTGMRGVRDCAQDTTALVPLDPAAARQTILELFSVQRSDGWFPRQYSIASHTGPHDLRAYVDGGVWVWELLFDYLCHTGDIGLLHKPVPWMDDDEDMPILMHAIELIQYYLDHGNRGEHGLCLIREGDWNDSVNRAGLDGRGESVMVSCQVVSMLRQAAHLFSHPLLVDIADASGLPGFYAREADNLARAILASALNDEGYLNGVFTDRGDWVFSPIDPDGKHRVNVPVNAFGIISGVLSGERADRALDVLESMRQRDGWPLFWPPIGDPPIRGLGRIGAGDLAPGLGENGTMYNHGCHGFLARAAAAAGRGDLLLEALRSLLPYDPEYHPVERSKTAPYAVVNHYRTAPGMEGRGGDAFLTGSISTGLRAVYDGIFGIRPLLDGLLLLPVVPEEWAKCSVDFTLAGRRISLSYTRGGEGPGLRLNGKDVTATSVDPVTGARGFFVPVSEFSASGANVLECVLGAPAGV